MKRFALSLVVFWIAPGAFCAEGGGWPDLEGRKISRIIVTTKRIREDYVRSLLPVKEGDVFRSADVEAARQKLFALRFFKKVDVSPAKETGGEGVELKITLEDGWYIFPLPFVSGGGGGTNGSLMLMARNLFRRAESIFLFGGGNPDGGFAAAGFQRERFSFSGSYGKRKFTEWGYADGGTNTTGRFRSSHAETSPEKYGTILNEYDRTTEEGGVQVRFPLAGALGGMAGFLTQRIDYGLPARGTAPADAGRANLLQAGLNFFSGGHGAWGRQESAFSFQDFGALFGYGLADISERIKPLPRPQGGIAADLGWVQSDRTAGSDFNFTKLGLGLSPSITFKHRQRFTLRLRGAASIREGLPSSQKIAANRELGMRGNYAREFRGDRGGTVSVSAVYPFRRTRRGCWTGEIFADAATVWEAGISRDKKGAGGSLTYQFWRFPLPLGWSYTYSLDDKESQVNFAFGGRF